MYQADRGNYRTNESMGKAFTHSCLGKLIILLAILIVLTIIAALTVPTEQQMTDEINDDILECIEANDSIKGDAIDDYVHNLGFIFTTADSTKLSLELRKAFDMYNRVEIYRHALYATAYIYNNLHPEGVRIGFGLYGTVIPTMKFSDFLLDNGIMHKGYEQKLIRSVIPDTDLGVNPNIQEYHYKRNPDD